MYKLMLLVFFDIYIISQLDYGVNMTWLRQLATKVRHSMPIGVIYNFFLRTIGGFQNMGNLLFRLAIFAKYIITLSRRRKDDISRQLF